MEESKLPKELLNKAAINAGGEHAWKKEDIPSSSLSVSGGFTKGVKSALDS